MIKYKLNRSSDDIYHEDQKISLINLPSPVSYFFLKSHNEETGKKWKAKVRVMQSQKCSFINCENYYSWF